MFPFITWQVLGVFVNFFALYIPHLDECNGMFFCIENQNLQFFYVWTTYMLSLQIAFRYICSTLKKCQLSAELELGWGTHFSLSVTGPSNCPKSATDCVLEKSLHDFGAYVWRNREAKKIAVKYWQNTPYSILLFWTTEMLSYVSMYEDETKIITTIVTIIIINKWPFFSTSLIIIKQMTKKSNPKK